MHARPQICARDRGSAAEMTDLWPQVDKSFMHRDNLDSTPIHTLSLLFTARYACNIVDTTLDELNDAPWILYD